LAEQLTKSTTARVPYAFSPDGKQILFRHTNPKSGLDIHVLSLDERREAPLVATVSNERNGEISPDGRWLAYQSDESGDQEIYVRPFPDVDAARWSVSAGGGMQPVWSRDGRELFFLANVDGQLFRLTSVTVDAGRELSIGKPQPLFEVELAVVGTAGRTYDVAREYPRVLGDVSDGRVQLARRTEEQVSRCAVRGTRVAVPTIRRGRRRVTERRPMRQNQRLRGLDPMRKGRSSECSGQRPVPDLRAAPNPVEPFLQQVRANC
jgi:hypothetical protein